MKQNAIWLKTITEFFLIVLLSLNVFFFFEYFRWKNHIKFFDYVYSLLYFFVNEYMEFDDLCDFLIV